MKFGNVGRLFIFFDALLLCWFTITCIPSARCYSSNSDVKNLHPGIRLSSPEECARDCQEGEPPKNCYYKWILESYPVLGRACEVCTPNSTDSLSETCQCVLADGVRKTILTANRMLPGPTVDVCLGDQIIVDVVNNIQAAETAIHWHGIFQKGYQYYDGVPLVTQCPTIQGNSFRYKFVANNAGTHFWHSHAELQKIDGLCGKLTVREPKSKDPNGNLYDKDLPAHEIIISDWMHQLALTRFPGLTGELKGQTPQSALINGRGQYTNPETGHRTKTPLADFTVKSGVRYRFRLINAFGTVCPAQFNIENHDMTVIATDGEAVRPVKVNTIISFAGERYDFILNANQTPGTYWIQIRGLGECGIDRVQQLAILRYEGGPHHVFSKRPTYDLGLPSGVVLNPLDAICDVPRNDAVCINQLEHGNPIDKGILQPHPDMRLFLSYHFSDPTPEQLFVPGVYDHFLQAPNNALSWVNMNNKSFVFPPSPPLSQLDDIPPTQFCNDNKTPTDCREDRGCFCTHRIDIALNSIVEIVLVDEVSVTNLSHPFHLHGYAFNVVGMGRSPDKNVKKITSKHVRDLHRRGLLKRNMKMLPFKDTIAVPNNGYVILRFRADNPGEWLLHCHFLYHIPIGMDVLLHVGNVTDLPPVPHGFPKCGNFLPQINPVDNKSEKSDYITFIAE